MSLPVSIITTSVKEPEVVAVVASSAGGGGFVSGMEIEQMEIVVTWMSFFFRKVLFFLRTPERC